MKTMPLVRLQAREDHVEAFKALAHLTCFMATELVHPLTACC